jgi:hypothetical protein
MLNHSVLYFCHRLRYPEHVIDKAGVNSSGIVILYVKLYPVELDNEQRLSYGNVCDIMIYWSTEQIFLRQTFFESLRYGTDGNLLCFY